MAMRMGRFKVVFSEQPASGLNVWREPCRRCGYPSLPTCAATHSSAEESI
jgi:hypothetical protein